MEADDHGEAYTAILRGVGLSHERNNVAGAEALVDVEGKPHSPFLDNLEALKAETSVKEKVRWAVQDGGPLKTITGLQGIAEKVDPPNNNGYERTQCWSEISQALTALTPFVDITAAEKAGFDVSRSFTFDSFQPKLPNKLGDFFSFTGC